MTDTAGEVQGDEIISLCSIERVETSVSKRTSCLRKQDTGIVVVHFLLSSNVVNLISFDLRLKAVQRERP